MREEIAFHITPRGNLGSILRVGIEARVGARALAAHEPAPAVYLFASAADAANALMNWLGDELDDDQDIAILEIDTRGLSLDEDGWELRSSISIPADRIREIQELDLLARASPQLQSL